MMFCQQRRVTQVGLICNFGRGSDTAQRTIDSGMPSDLMIYAEFVKDIFSCCLSTVVQTAVSSLHVVQHQKRLGEGPMQTPYSVRSHDVSTCEYSAYKADINRTPYAPSLFSDISPHVEGVTPLTDTSGTPSNKRKLEYGKQEDDSVDTDSRGGKSMAAEGAQSKEWGLPRTPGSEAMAVNEDPGLHQYRGPVAVLENDPRIQEQGSDVIALITRFAKVPENRALARDMIGAAAGASVKALIQNLDGVASVWPERWSPWRVSLTKGVSSTARLVVAPSAHAMRRTWMVVGFIVFVFMWIVQHEQVAWLGLLRSHVMHVPS